MKKLFLLITMLLVAGMYSYAQPGIITAYAGTGAVGYSGDGGPAINATFNNNLDIIIGSMTVDAYGNFFIADGNVIRKINAATGIITTVAGNNTINNTSYSGEGGLAINASLGEASGLSIDNSGNLYIGVFGSRIVKVNATTGIINTYAGTGNGGAASGDGGLAINATIGINGITIDGLGNLFISDFNSSSVRKIDAFTGIITTVAGNGIQGFSGDGGLAVNAQLADPLNLATDHEGNLYICDYYNGRVRKVDATTGIITTYAGGGTNIGDGGLATNASVAVRNISFDINDNLLIAELTANGRIRKVNRSTGIISTIAGGNPTIVNPIEGLPATGISFGTGVERIASGNGGDFYFVYPYSQKIYKVFGSTPPNISSDSFGVYINHTCSGAEFSIAPSHYSPNMHVTTWFGDGQSAMANVGYVGYAGFTHNYTYSGVYTIKHVLYNGTIALDSVTYSYTYDFCRTLPIRLYNDANNDCVFNSGTEFLLNLPTTIEIDSNGVSIDTVTVLSGMDYNANGNPGDIYKFKILNTVTGFTVVCPVSGFITDTLVAGNNNTKYIGFHCNSATGFDLAEQVSMQTRTSWQQGTIIVNNNYCTPQNAVVTLNISPKYVFSSANITPASVNGNTITWNINNVSSGNPPTTINYTLTVPNPSNPTLLLLGDTVHSSVVITPIAGDVNPANNTNIRIDTVKSSFDPNEMAVSPRPYIQAGDQLQYTIQFENTGNDTAQNISVLDTLPNSLNIHTLAMVASTHSCIFSKKWTGSNWVAKFDFPNIKLLDSSHHNQCTGMLVFNIKAKTGLAVGTTIFNHAAIYFDDNPPVITDTVVNIITAPTSVINTIVSTVNIYPNPAKNVLHIDNLKEEANYRIVNLLGATIEQGLLQAGNNEIKIDTIPAGIYLLQLTNQAGQREVIRVVKE